ncbi:MAG: hypothetical protein HC893_06390 [Chloroflexaceae bacterium]|nr:hypothetical protein [Chloroflexaceae bacterium]
MNNLPTRHTNSSLAFWHALPIWGKVVALLVIVGAVFYIGPLLFSIIYLSGIWLLMAAVPLLALIGLWQIFTWVVYKH